MLKADIDIDNVKDDPLLSMVFNAINDGILITDGNGIVTYVNNAYCEITKIQREDIISKSVADVRKGSRLPDVLKTGRPLRGLKRCESNSEYIADIHPIITEKKVIGAISVIRDITELASLSSKLNDYYQEVTKLKNKVSEIHKAKYTLDDIIGKSNKIEKAKSMASRVADSDVPVLILGESGTGKELFAHAIHNLSSRSSSPFVPINCAAFPPNLLLSELFGYETGAFTGANKGGKLGLFEIANNGTLFLDEIGDMDYELQSKLLRVLETGEFIRLGGTKPITVNVRIISATNRELDKMIQENLFRQDLYYRLNVVSIKIPPLRERSEDIPMLTEFYMKRMNAKKNSIYTISLEALDILQNYDFPGNIRELINTLEFSVNICTTRQITPQDLPLISKIKTKYTPANRGSFFSTFKTSEQNAIIKALETYGVSVDGKREAAKHLGISLATLYNKINQYSI